MDNNIRYRHEIKYRINAGVYFILRQRFRAVMHRDANTSDGLYRVTSLYFDDAYDSAYRDKVNGVLNRKKYRIRIYNGENDFIRLEEKVKNADVGYKKMTVLTAEQYSSLISGDSTFLSDECYCGSAGGDFFASCRAAALHPAVIVDYYREPYVCHAGNVRITFDMKVSACVNGIDVFSPENIFELVMPENDIILEVKYDSFLPEHIRQLLTGVPAVQESISKYVMCRDRLSLRR